MAPRVRRGSRDSRTRGSRTRGRPLPPPGPGRCGAGRGGAARVPGWGRPRSRRRSPGCERRPLPPQLRSRERCPAGAPEPPRPASPGPRTMIPPGECTYAGRKRRRPLQKRRPALGVEKSNPSKRHRDRLNAELDHLASLLPFPPDIISKLDKLSVLRLSVSYLRVKSFFQAVQEQGSRQPVAGTPSPEDSHPPAGSAVLEGRLLLETDVMHQNIYDYIHVDDRQDFRRQLHWAMDPPQVVSGQPPPSETGDDAVLGRLLRAQEWGAGVPIEYSAFLTRCFVCRVRCLLDSTSGFLTMQFQGKLKFLFGQKKKAPSGAVLPPRLSLFCVVAPVLLPSATEMKMRSALLRAKPRADSAAPTDAKVKATMSLCKSEQHGKPNYSAGRSSRESGILVLREQTDTGQWAQVPARAPCLCLRGSPDLVLKPKRTSRDREEQQQRVLSRASGASGRRETPGPTKPLPWMAGRRSEDGARPKVQPNQSGLLSLRPTSHGSCLPYPCVQGTFNASSSGTFRNLPISQPPSPPPSAHAIRTSRASWDVCEDQVHPPLCHFPQGSLQHPQPETQHLASRGYTTEDGKLRGVQMPPRGLCSPTLLLDVPIKMEKDSGSEDAAHGCMPSQVWGLGAGDRSRLVTFPTRMPLKTEPDSLHQVYTAHLGHGVLGAQPQGRATMGRSRELATFHPAHCARLEPTHSLPQLEPPHQLCARGRGELSSLPSCTCRAAETAPVVKREPLDSPPWATYSQGRAPGMFPKSALATLVPPQASECTFLP
uniref:aryl hydrocarbon receptor repressor isoform X2 n=1 Tax=Callithrix jacchus TaxID=9483 RepID=UPI0023DCF4DF|nr:aryl hydrocarbon receptor repressor isoform X2 [Callithrix jacchus]